MIKKISKYSLITMTEKEGSINNILIVALDSFLQNLEINMGREPDA
jgi:hypothetical protein